MYDLDSRNAARPILPTAEELAARRQVGEFRCKLVDWVGIDLKKREHRLQQFPVVVKLR